MPIGNMNDRYYSLLGYRKDVDMKMDCDSMNMGGTVGGCCITRHT